MSFFQLSSPLAARRLFLGRTGLPLSGVAVALLAGNEALATKAGGAGAQDVQILNTALGAELEAIAAYQLGAESKLLRPASWISRWAFRAITTRSTPTCSPSPWPSWAAKPRWPRPVTSSRSSSSSRRLTC